MRTSYAFPNAWELARRRLELLEAAHDPSSFRRALQLVKPAMWCLDAGAGNGSFARWLAGQVGEHGGVIAADIDVRLLEEIDTPGVEVHQMNLETDELPEAEFDFIHTRLLLIHLRRREEVLRRLAAALRPGGVLMVEEDDIYPIRAVADGPYREAWDTFYAMTERAGVDATWARTLPARLEALGLVGVDAELDTQLFRGGSAPAEMWSLTWLQTREDVDDAAAIDRGRAALADASQWFYGPAKVIAWGRRPPARADRRATSA
jgi:SAM-dependent methyltransferase